jgi:peptide deformylase
VNTVYPATLSVLRYPAPVLRKIAKPVSVFDAGLRDFIGRMFDCMYGAKGVGLAAPQVGVSERIFITDHAQRDDKDKHDRRAFINPRIENGRGEETYEEGCLSFPGIYAKVTRWNNFDIVYQDEHGAEHRQSFDVNAGDFLGVVFQHELDHLDGKVFVDYLTPAQLILVRRALRDLEKEWKDEHGREGAVLRR